MMMILCCRIEFSAVDGNHLLFSKFGHKLSRYLIDGAMRRMKSRASGGGKMGSSSLVSHLEPASKLSWAQSNPGGPED